MLDEEAAQLGDEAEAFAEFDEQGPDVGAPRMGDPPRPWAARVAFGHPVPGQRGEEGAVAADDGVGRAGGGGCGRAERIGGDGYHGAGLLAGAVVSTTPRYRGAPLLSKPLAIMLKPTLLLRERGGGL